MKRPAAPRHIDLPRLPPFGKIELVKVPPARPGEYDLGMMGPQIRPLGLHRR